MFLVSDDEIEDCFHGYKKGRVKLAAGECPTSLCTQWLLSLGKER